MRILNLDLPEHLVRNILHADAKIVNTPVQQVALLGFFSGIAPWLGVYAVAILNYAISGAKSGIFRWLANLWLLHVIALGLGFLGVSFALLRRWSVAKNWFYLIPLTRPIRLSLDHLLALVLTVLLWGLLGISKRGVLFLAAGVGGGPVILILGLMVVELWEFFFSRLIRWFGVLPPTTAEQIEQTIAIKIR